MEDQADSLFPILLHGSQVRNVVGDGHNLRARSSACSIRYAASVCSVSVQRQCAASVCSVSVQRQCANGHFTGALRAVVGGLMRLLHDPQGTGGQGCPPDPTGKAAWITFAPLPAHVELRTCNAKCLAGRRGLETRGPVARFVSAPSGLGFRPARETSAVRSHAEPQRTQRGLPGSEPVAVVADAAWNRLCTSPRDGHKLGGTKRLRQHARETSAVRSHAEPQRTQRGLPGSELVAVVADAAWNRLCTSPRDGHKLGGTKRLRQHARETSAVRSHAEPQRTQRGLPGSELVAVVADAAWSRFCTSRRDGRELGGDEKISATR